MHRNYSGTPAFSLLPGVGLICLFLTLLGTCARAPKTVTSVVGSVRYDETSKLLTADLAISPTSATAPTLFGSAMPAFPAAGPGHFRGRRNLPFANPIRFNAPCTSEPSTGCDLVLPFTPPVVDNIPDSIRISNNLRFQTSATGLEEAENLIVFFEPNDRSTPQRILLQGPTSSGNMSIPKEAMVDFIPGPYEVYLIKQRLYQDSLPTLVTSIQMEYFTRSVPVVVY